MDISRNKELTTVHLNPLRGITLQGLFPKRAPANPAACTQVASYTEVKTGAGRHTGARSIRVKGHSAGHVTTNGPLSMYWPGSLNRRVLFLFYFSATNSSTGVGLTTPLLYGAGPRPSLAGSFCVMVKSTEHGDRLSTSALRLSKFLNLSEPQLPQL